VFFAVKILLSAILIAFVSWLSGRDTKLAGFLTAMPLVSMIAIAFSQAQFKDSAQSVEYAKSIFTAIPLSLLFFVPFLLAKHISLPFWGLYFCGVAAVFVGYLIHQKI